MVTLIENLFQMMISKKKSGYNLDFDILLRRCPLKIYEKETINKFLTIS